MSFTFTEVVILLLVFALGWLLGMLSHRSSKRWKHQLAEERAAHAAYRRDTEARLATANTAPRHDEFGHRAAPAAPAHETTRFRKDGRPV